MVRHINSKITAEYWKLCYMSIRNYYKEHIIVVIDDHSDKKYINDDMFPVYNTVFINSTLQPGIGELLSYYYFYTHHFFEKAVIIHDSVFIHQFMDFNSINNVKFLWSFNHNNSGDNKEMIYNIISQSNKQELLKHFYDNGNWYGCFGIMSVITYSFLEKIIKQYNFIDILTTIKVREERCAMERIFAMMCYLEYPELERDISFFGDIHQYINWGLTFDEYIKNNEVYKHYPIMKVWSGR